LASKLKVEMTKKRETAGHAVGNKEDADTNREEAKADP
jgi:hypothetical protein